MIRGEKVDLVAPSMAFFDHYLKWINDPEVTDMLGNVRYPMSREKEQKFVEEILSPKSNMKLFTVVTKDGVPIGNISFNSINWLSRRAMVGIMIGEKSYWNRGFGTDAMRTLLRFGFEELGLHKIELGVHSLNKRAIKCYQKCGFVLERTAREHDFYQGRYVDGLGMGVLREEWEASQRKAKPSRKSR